jgi:hypothetical protein
MADIPDDVEKLRQLAIQSLEENLKKQNDNKTIEYSENLQKNELNKNHNHEKEEGELSEGEIPQNPKEQAHSSPQAQKQFKQGEFFFDFLNIRGSCEFFFFSRWVLTSTLESLLIRY